VIMSANSAKSEKRNVLFLLAPLLLPGCSRAPSVDILGSFFPAWLFCLVAAILLATLTRLVMLRIRVKVALPILVYSSFTVLLTFALWLIFFH
jgi:YtcA family